MKNFKIKPLILAVAAVSAGIAGCGGTGQDDGGTHGCPSFWQYQRCCHSIEIEFGHLPDNIKHSIP